jgi:hypothetical protein
MLKQTPATQLGERQNEPSADAPASIFEGIAAPLAKFAKIPPQKTEQFADHIEFSIICWVVNADFGSSRAARDFLGLLNDTRNTATRLQQKLKEAQRYLEERHRVGIRPMGGLEWWRRIFFTLNLADFGIAKPVQPDLVARAISVLSELTAALNKISRPRGRRRGVKEYPGLEVLIFDLEQAARENGGGFTLDKRCRKGTIVDALNWLRAYCSGLEGELEKYLPPRGRHSASQEPPMVTRLPARSSARRPRPPALQARRQDEAVHRRAHRPHHRGPPMSIKLIPPSKKRRTPFFSGRGTYLGVRVDRSTKTDRRALAKGSSRIGSARSNVVSIEQARK